MVGGGQGGGPGPDLGWGLWGVGRSSLGGELLATPSPFSLVAQRSVTEHLVKSYTSGARFDSVMGQVYAL